MAGIDGGSRKTTEQTSNKMMETAVVVKKGVRIQQLKREVAECKQRGLSMEAYYAKMNTLWEELEAHYQQRIPNPSYDIQKLWEEEKVHQLLMGLDDTVFANVRSALLAMDPLPSLNQVYSTLIQEEDARNPLFKFPKEIVDGILMRLPPKSLFTLKSVSIGCKSFVMDPKFAHKYMKQRGSDGLLLSPPLQLRGMLYPLMEGTWEPRIPSAGCREFPSSPHADHIHHRLLIFYAPYSIGERTRILASSNGLVLSQLQAFRLDSRTAFLCRIRIELYLSNPLINKSFRLPPTCAHESDSGGSRTLWTCGIATRANGSSSSSSSSSSYKIEYKVVFIRTPRGWNKNTGKADAATVNIFSSDTGSWTGVVSEGGGGGVIRCPQAVFQNVFQAPDFCYKGILHWIDDSGTRTTIVTYDPYDTPGRFGHIPLPNANNAGSSGTKLTLTSMILFHLDHEDSLKCCEIEQSSDNNLSLLVWRIVDYDKGEWCLEQRRRISPLCGGGLLKGCRQVIALEAGFCYAYARDNRVTAVDLASGEEEDVNISEVFKGPKPFDRLPLVPFVYCPWASPIPDQTPVLPETKGSKRKRM